MIDAFIANDVVLALGLALVHFLWQGTAIAVATAALLTTFPRAAPGTRYGIACIGLLAMTITPVMTVASSLASPGLLTSVTTASATTSLAEAIGTNHASATLAARLAAWLPGIVTVWAAGVLFLTLRLMRAWWSTERVRRIGTVPVSEGLAASVGSLARRLGLQRPVSMSESTQVDVPTVIGWLRPTILVPIGALAGLSPYQLEAVLSHELAHIRRHDYLVNGIQNVVETLFFYHPGVWWVSQQIRIEREHCCDDVAVTVCGNRVAYARALASLEEARQQRAAFALAATDGPLLTRVRRLVGASPRTEYRPSLSIAAGIVALMIAAGFSVAHARGTTSQTVAQSPVEATPLAGVTETIHVSAPRIAGAPRSAAAVHPRSTDREVVAVAVPPPPAAAPVRATSVQQPPPPPPAPSLQAVRVGGAIREPKKVVDRRPLYPQLARDAGISGVVILEATIDPDGNVANIKVLRSIPQLDQAAINAVRQWKYTPTTLNGTPIPVIMTVTVNFTLTSNLQTAARVAGGTSAESEARAAALRQELDALVRNYEQMSGNPAAPPSVPRVGGEISAPRKIFDMRPRYPAIAQAANVEGIVILEATIDTGGNVTNARILRSIPMLDEAALDAVLQWKYTPPMLNGVPTTVVMTMTVNFTLDQ